MPPRLRLFLDAGDVARADTLLGEGPPPVVIGVTAGHPDKVWPPDRWARVADYIAGRGFRVLFGGAPSEVEQIEAVRRRMQRDSETLAGALSLRQFAALLKRCLCLVTLDSAPMHIAVAVGAPVIALFGATSSRQWGPYPNGRPTIVVEPPREIPRNAEAMRWIEVHHVTGAFDRLIAQIDVQSGGAGSRDL